VSVKKPSESPLCTSPDANASPGARLLLPSHPLARQLNAQCEETDPLRFRRRSQGRELGVSIPDYRAVRTSMKVAGGRPISPSQRKDGRDPLFETMELTMLELHRAPAASAKSEQEKKDLLAQLDLLRMAVEQLTVYRMVRVLVLHPATLPPTNTVSCQAQAVSASLWEAKCVTQCKGEIGTFHECIRSALSLH
jgi:hypothetical protein